MIMANYFVLCACYFLIYLAKEIMYFNSCSPRVLFRTVLKKCMGHSTLSSVRPSKSNHGTQTVPGATILVIVIK